MEVEWAKLIVTLLTSVAIALWAVFSWTKQREAEREKERKKLAALYVNPFLSACEELQSRLYNILERAGLSALRRRYPDGTHAEETLYLIVQYFGWERCIRRYGPYTHDSQVIKLTEAVRATFATDKPERVGPFCFFRPEQKALGQTVMKRSAGEFGPEFETISLHEFKQQLSSPTFVGMKSVTDTLAALRVAESVEKLKGRYRVAEVQNYLVKLLTYAEERERFTLFPGPRKTAGRERNWTEWAEGEGWC